MDFYSAYWPGLCPGRRVHTAHRDRRARDQRRIGAGRGAAVPRRGRRPGGFPRTHAVGLLDRGHPDAGCAARRRRGCAAGHRGGLSRPAARCSWSVRRCATSTASTTPPWSSTAARCSGWRRSRTCRPIGSSTSAVRWRPAMTCAASSVSAGAGRRGGALRPGPTVRRRRSARLRPSRRDLRGHVRADTAERRGRTRRRDGDREPLRQPDHDRPRRGSLPARPVGVVALPGGLRVRRGGRRRVDDRPGVGRPDDDLRERRAAGRCRSGSPRGQRRSVADVDLELLRAERLRMGTFDDNRVHHGIDVDSFRRIEFELDPPAGDIGLRREVERFPFVPSDPHTAGTGLLRGLQHPGRRGWSSGCAR